MCVEKDQWGASFAHMVNGVRFFAMGGDYIPEEHLLGRISSEKRQRLLEDAKLVAGQAEELGFTNVVINDVSPSIGTHAGPGVVGLVFYGKKVK